jgi:VCBS repeat-containing protein
MAYRTIGFEGAEITDSNATDGVVVAGGLKFTVYAAGAWTLTFNNGRLNFAEDVAFAGSQFKIEITSVTGGSLQYNDFIINYQSDPLVVGGWAPYLSFSGTTISDADLAGNYTHNGEFSYKHQIPGFPAMPGSGVVSKLVITDNPANGSTQNPYSSFWLDEFVIDTDFAPLNVAPTFVGATTSLSTSQNSTTVDVSALLHVSDSDSAQTLTWSMVSAPGHGTLSLSGATAASGSTNISPGGSITYTPVAGFAGVDTFTVQVSDGTAITTRTITVNVNPSSPGSPDLAAASDTGLSSADNVTAASLLAFSGTGPTGDTTSTVRVFIDQNGNGAYDATDASATATMNNGAWSVSGLSTTSLSSGTYNVYALITSASGGLVSAASSPLAITLDKTAPSITFSGLALSSDTGASSSDFITNVAPQTIIATLSGSLESGDRVMGSLDNGVTWSDITSKVSGTSLTWSGVTLAGSSTIRLQILDQHGNGGAIASQAYTLDTSAPNTAVGSAALSADTGLSATDFVTRAAAQIISGTLSANLAAGEAVQVSLDNGNTWTTAIASVGSNAWSLAGMVLSGSNTLVVKVTDSAGNDGAVHAQAYVLDTTAPTLVITSDRSLFKAGETATITFTFSEDPGATFTWNGSAGDIVVSGGTLSALSGSGTTRTAVFTPSAGLNSGTASITVAAGSYTDTAGNSGGVGATPSLFPAVSV